MKFCDKHIEVSILISSIFLVLSFLGSGIFAIENVLNQTSTPTSKMDTGDWKNYSNSIYGFKIKYPGNWETLERGRVVIFGLSDDPDVQFFVEVKDIVANESIQEIVRDNIFSFKSLAENVVMTEPNKTKLASGVEIYQYQYTYELPITGTPLKGFSAIAINDGLKYTLEYSANPNAFARNIPIVKTVINSFEPVGFEFK